LPFFLPIEESYAVTVGQRRLQWRRFNKLTALQESSTSVSVAILSPSRPPFMFAPLFALAAVDVEGLLPAEIDYAVIARQTRLLPDFSRSDIYGRQMTFIARRAPKAAVVVVVILIFVFSIVVLRLMFLRRPKS